MNATHLGAATTQSAPALRAWVTAVVWATGLSRDSSFVDAPILDRAGTPGTGAA